MLMTKKLFFKSSLIKLLPMKPNPPVTIAFFCIKIFYSNEKKKYTFFLNIFSDKNYIILFWIHFLAINLFCGSWISRDGSRLAISKYLTFFPLIVTYFIGPLGIFIYWVIRIFYAKKISLYD